MTYYTCVYSVYNIYMYIKWNNNSKSIGPKFCL